MRLRRSALLIYTVFVSATAQAQSFFDDAESTTVTIDEQPPGRWTDRFSVSGSSFTNTAAAAHRGTRGLRADDGTATGTRNLQAFAHHVISPSFTGEYHLRFWVRPSRMSSSGSSLVGAILAEQQDLLNLEIRAPNGEVRIAGFGDNGWVGVDLPMTKLEANLWHLVELSVRGVGTNSGSREVRINGTTVHSDAMPWTSRKVARLKLGAYWADPVTFTGILDFDDVRGDTTEHASKFVVSPIGPFPAGECTPLTVSLASSDDQPRPSPYAFRADLMLDGVAGDFYEDAACQTPTNTADVASGATSTPVYVKASSEGDAAIRASYIDFLEGSTAVQVTPEVMTDAGTQPGPDAGSEEDAGVEVPDGGLPDAGIVVTAPIAVVVPVEITVPPGSRVELDGSSSLAAPGAVIGAYRWELIEGPTYIDMVGREKLSVEPHEPGTYVFRLVVTDSLERTSLPSTARVIVDGDVLSPDARFGCGCTANGGIAPLAALGLILSAAFRRARTPHA